ncbi:MAG: hypothetical protein KAT77_04390 [Nanoarchaeota archaeon]|nr:hypothetical protein [Nanoarchaeota archaeon]
MKKKSKPLKRSKTGVELEVQTLNEKGFITNKADFLIKECKKQNKNILLYKECGKHMLEFVSFPSVHVNNTTAEILKTYKIILETAEKNNIIIYPLSTYPGKFRPKIRQSKWYALKKKVLGKERFQLAGKSIAFHCHYTLPRGVFDKKNKSLKPLLSPKIKQTLIDSYNMGIAMDPALVTFHQSSPFLDGKFLAKDSRIVIYRGDRVLKFPGALYTGYTQYGNLPPYKQTLTDLIYTLKSRHARMKRVLEKKGIPASDISKYGKILDFCWNPIKINKHGTIEQRSMDMNYPEIFTAGSVLIKYVQRKIHQDFMKVVPSEIGIEEPFKREDNLVYIAPHTHVRKQLQYLSAYKGLEDKYMHMYCKRFFKFARNLINKRYIKVIQPFADMLDEKKTVSDLMLKKIRKKGYNPEKQVPDQVMAELALEMSQKTLNKIQKTEQMVKHLD